MLSTRYLSKGAQRLGHSRLASTTVDLRTSSVLSKKAAHLAPTVLREMLQRLVQRGQDPQFSISSVKELKSVLYNARAANDKALVVDVVERFVEPQIKAASVDPAVFTLTIQVLEEVGELVTASSLFDIMWEKKAANLVHVCAFLNAMRQTNRRESRKIPNGVRARITRGLELYKKSTEIFPGADGSVVLAASTLALLNTANRQLLAYESSWVQRARDIVDQLSRRNISHQLLSGHLMTIVAKSVQPLSQEQGTAVAVSVAGGLAESRKIFAELEERGQAATAYSLYSLTLAAFNSQDFQSCQEIYESMAQTVSPHPIAFRTYIKACAAESGGAGVAKGLEAMFEWAALSNPIDKTHFPLQLARIYKQSLDDKRVPQTPQLKLAQKQALKLLDDVVTATFGKQHLVSAMPLYVVTGPVAVHFAITGRLDDLLRHYPRITDYTSVDRDVLSSKSFGWGGTASSSDSPLPFPEGCFTSRSKIFNFWNELAWGLRLGGHWRYLLALRGRVELSQTASSRDRMAVLGHLLYCLAAFGRGEEALRLLRSSGVLKLVSQCEESAALLLLRGHTQADSKVDEKDFFLQVFRVLVEDAGISSSKTLALAKNCAKTKEQVAAVEAVMSE